MIPQQAPLIKIQLHDLSNAHQNEELCVLTAGSLLILGVFCTIISRDAICWVGWTVIPDTHRLPLPAKPWRWRSPPHWWPGRYNNPSPPSEHPRWTALRSWTPNNGPTGKEVGRGKAASMKEDRLLSSHHGQNTQSLKVCFTSYKLAWKTGLSMFFCTKRAWWSRVCRRTLMLTMQHSPILKGDNSPFNWILFKGQTGWI